MTPERWRAVSPHLDRLLELEAAGRDAYLAELAGHDAGLAEDLARLLAEGEQARRGGFLDGEPAKVLAESSLAGQAFGAYTLVRPLGAGGMGTVWLAQRSDGRFAGHAAVKLLSAGLLGAAGQARFRREGSILARLQHPHIARLLDAGITPLGQPYLVLEYVEGEPIDRYCDERRLDLRARLRLFLDVLSAVAHAHTKLVVHRDLKPSNVLVSRAGAVKLLDFGIAKLIEGDDGEAPTLLTREAARLFTPAFAAPEQVTGGDITTATDVHALGALLYLLLTGRAALGDATSSPAELVRSVVETDPERPSQAVASAGGGSEQERLRTAAARASTPQRLRRELAGDLDTIVAKALKKRPQERYPSAAALADDLSRYLADEPIAARPDSLGYRAAKFARRHARSLAASALALLALATVVALFGLRLSRERDRAAEASRFLTELLTQTDPYAAERRETTVDGLLAAGAERARRDLADQPELQLEVLTLLGRIAQRRGDLGMAVALLEDAVALARRIAGPSAQLASSLNDLGVALAARAEVERARAILEEALALRRRLFGAEHLEVAVTEVELGRVYEQLGRLEEAEALFRSSLAIRRKLLGPDDHEVATSLSDLGLLLRERGQAHAAEALLAEALAVTRRASGPSHPDVGTALNNLALTRRDRDDYAGAEALLAEALTIGRASLGARHPLLAGRLSNIGSLQRMQGKLEEAEGTLGEALAMGRAVWGEEHPSTAGIEAALARVYLDRQEPARAEPLLRDALAVQRRSLPPGDWRTATSESLLGAVLLALGRPAEAEPLLLAAHRSLRSGAGAGPVELREAAANRARLVALYEAWGQPERAAPYRAP